MKKYMKNLLLTLMTGLFPLLSIAQKSIMIPDWERKVNKVFSNDKSDSVLSDSVALYSFNVKLNIVKGKTGSAKVNRIIANDQLVYSIFPDYKALYSIDYSALLGSRNNINLVIPIIIYSTSPTGKSKYARQREVALIDMEAAVNVLEKSFTSYMGKGKKPENVIFTYPRIIHIVNLKDKESAIIDHKVN